VLGPTFRRKGNRNELCRYDKIAFPQLRYCELKPQHWYIGNKSKQLGVSDRESTPPGTKAAGNLEMLTKIKIALTIAIVLCTTFTAAAGTTKRHRVESDNLQLSS